MGAIPTAAMMLSSLLLTSVEVGPLTEGKIFLLIMIIMKAVLRIYTALITCWKQLRSKTSQPALSLPQVGKRHSVRIISEGSLSTIAAVLIVRLTATVAAELFPLMLDQSPANSMIGITVGFAVSLSVLHGVEGINKDIRSN